jgi:hypothetical protein
MGWWFGVGSRLHPSNCSYKNHVRNPIYLEGISGALWARSARTIGGADRSGSVSGSPAERYGLIPGAFRAQRQLFARRAGTCEELEGGGCKIPARCFGHEYPE